MTKHGNYSNESDVESTICNMANRKRKQTTIAVFSLVLQLCIFTDGKREYFGRFQSGVLSATERLKGYNCTRTRHVHF